jgi:hypothetical protein
MAISATSSGEHSSEGGASQSRRLMNPILLLIIILLPCANLYQAIASVDPTALSIYFMPTVVPDAKPTDLAHMVIYE